jgi:hypothetical protein
MLKFKKIELLTKIDKICRKSEHGCCDHKTSRNITSCADMREIFFGGRGGWLFVDGESWD